MGKRIRHLEFYGYPDQNVFTSIGNIDLSEIKELTDDKADQSALLELSGKVDTFIDEQDEFNRGVVDAFSGTTDRISALENRDEEITNKINELTDEVNESKIIVGDLEESVSELNEKLNEHISGYNDFVESVNDRFVCVGEALDEKLDKNEADDIYAKKTEVYSRDEADVTFLKEHQDISYLATKDELAAVDAKVDAIDVDSFAKKEDLDTVSGDLESFKEETENNINDINDSISGITSDVEKSFDQINFISGAVDSVVEDLNDAKENINALSESAVSISNEIENIEGEFSKYVTTSAFTEYVNDQDEVNNSKADKSELNFVSGAVDDLSSELDQEKIDRANGDIEIGERIDGVDDNIEELRVSASSFVHNIENLNDKLDEETQNRINADASLVGTSADTMLDDTIWGAKKYSVYQKSLAVSESNEYTDNVFDTMETMLTNELDSIRTDLSSKASKDYVDDVVDERDTQIRNDLNASINSEVTRAKASENNLQFQINELEDRIGSADTRDIYKRLNVITTYTGDTPEQYIDSGNGVLDVLHREFHELEDEIGIVTNPTLQKTNEYEVAFGEYNISNTDIHPSGQTIFSIGMGTSDQDRRNALEVRKDGSVYMWVEGEYLNINDLLSMLAHETYN